MALGILHIFPMMSIDGAGQTDMEKLILAARQREMESVALVSKPFRDTLKKSRDKPERVM